MPGTILLVTILAMAIETNYHNNSQQQRFKLKPTQLIFVSNIYIFSKNIYDSQSVLTHLPRFLSLFQFHQFSTTSPRPTTSQRTIHHQNHPPNETLLVSEVQQEPVPTAWPYLTQQPAARMPKHRMPGSKGHKG